jgi:hypothetical protein
MPRRSSASYVVPLFQGKPVVPKASPGLPPEVAKVFREIVRAVPAGHFRASDACAIETFAGAVSMGRRAEREIALSGPILPDGKPSPWLRIQAEASKVIASLSMRLIPTLTMSDRRLPNRGERWT